MELRFLLDGMLGRLARWLRILGYDTEYRSDLSDNELLTAAAKENRILLTRDKNLNRKAMLNNIESHLLESVSLTDWLASLKRRYDMDLKLDKIKPRCSLCNGLLNEASSEIALDTLPAGVRAKHSRHWSCPGCLKVYWRGSHWENMSELLQSVEKSRMRART